MLKIIKQQSIKDMFEVADLEIYMNDKRIYDCSIWTDDEDEPLNGALHFFMPLNNELEYFSLSDFISEQEMIDFGNFIESSNKQDSLIFNTRQISDFDNYLMSEGVQYGTN